MTTTQTAAGTRRTLDPRRARRSTHRMWEKEILPPLEQYIGIECRSQAFEPKWRKKGHIQRAVRLISGWCRKQPIHGMTVKVERLPGRTPLIFIEIAGFAGSSESVPEGTVLLYGHLDKQPELSAWKKGLHPWKAVRRGSKLYGRGGADDGYSAFASMAAIRLLQEQGVAHARCVVMIEAGEESGSPDLPAYVDHLKARIGTPDLVICLDSGCGDYNHLWTTTSLRGLVTGRLRVQILTEGVHSGSATGIVPSSFRIIRQLLDRIENQLNGDIKLVSLYCTVPTDFSYLS